MLRSKTFNEAKEILANFRNEYHHVVSIAATELNKISYCDKNTIIPPLSLDETADSFCLLVTVKDFDSDTFSLPSIYQGMRVYYKKKKAVFIGDWVPMEPVAWTNAPAPTTIAITEQPEIFATITNTVTTTTT